MFLATTVHSVEAKKVPGLSVGMLFPLLVLPGLAVSRLVQSAGLSKLLNIRTRIRSDGRRRLVVPMSD